MNCQWCKEPMEAWRSTKKYCSAACRKAHNRAEKQPFGVDDHELELKLTEELFWAELKMREKI